jgi:hypothetical protein
MSFSVWEIELSRYARFYTAFQLMYLVSLICFYRGFMLDEGKYKIWFLISAFITFSTHALSQVLIVCFLIPLLSSSHSFRRKLVFCFWAIGSAGLFKLYQKLVGAIKAFGDPLQLVEAGGEKEATTVVTLIGNIRSFIGIPRLRFPDFSFFMQFFQQHPLELTGLALIPGIAMLYFIYRFFQGDHIGKVILAIAMVWTAFFYQFGLLLIMLAIYLLVLARDFRNLWDPILRIVYIVASMCFAIWGVIIAVYPDIPLRRLRLAMFGFPNFYDYFLNWFVRGWPVMTIFFVVGCVMLLSRHFSNRRDPVPLFVLGAFFIPAILVSFFKANPESRYAFHLYPLVVIVFAMVITLAITYILKRIPVNILKRIPIKNHLSRNLTVLVMFVSVLFISQDANPLEAWQIGNRTYTSPRDPIRGVINWTTYARFHQDHKSPSLFVKKHLSPGDQVVVLGSTYVVMIYRYYVGQVNYNVYPMDNFGFLGILTNNGYTDYVTGSIIIPNLTDLQEFIENSSGGLWLLGDDVILDDDTNFYPAPLIEYLRSIVRKPDFVGLDGHTFAVKVR